jgi:hypothetical protein
MMKNNAKRKMQRANHPHFERGKKTPFFAHAMDTKIMPKQKIAKISQISPICLLENPHSITKGNRQQKLPD